MEGESLSRRDGADVGELSRRHVVDQNRGAVAGSVQNGLERRSRIVVDVRRNRNRHQAAGIRSAIRGHGKGAERAGVAVGDRVHRVHADHSNDVAQVQGRCRSSPAACVEVRTGLVRAAHNRSSAQRTDDLAPDVLIHRELETNGDAHLARYVLLAHFFSSHWHSVCR